MPDEIQQAPSKAQRAVARDRMLVEGAVAHSDEEGRDAVQLHPLVPAVAAPLEGDGDDLADRRLWGGELTDTN